MGSGLLSSQGGIVALTSNGRWGFGWAFDGRHPQWLVGVVDSLVQRVVDPTSLKRGDDLLGAVLCVVDVCWRREWGWSVGWNE